MNENNKKPLISFALFAYNQEQFIEEAIKGAFSQTYTPLEIILSDDCSPDGTFAIMEKMASEYEGPHKVVLNKNKKNLGLIGHVNTVLTELCRGEIIVVAAGDDISLPNRVEETWKVFDSDEEVMSVTMSYQNINKEGQLLKTKSFPTSKPYLLSNFLRNNSIPILGCTRAFRKNIINVFGELDSGCGVEDSNLMFRSLLLGKSYHLNKVGVKYRRLTNSISNNINDNNFSGIIKQRLLDLNKAKNLKLISAVLYKESLLIVESSERKHKEIKNLFSVRNKIYYYVFNVLFNRDFSLQEKVTYFKYVIKTILKP